ncbi:Translin [Gigaspora margarita]|uniref:Translin n=1 Tax=Gigaspora margarita TaxID=4874 RepID=A0A8H4EST5_GIGMA|nr:Translin [Gigaspora margarita]
MATISDPSSDDIAGEVSIRSLFESFRDSLDQHYDRRERIVKASRDITALSKKLIGLAHRVTQKPLKSILQEANEKKDEISQLFKEISLELQGINYYRYHKNISPSIQEFIEAISFLEYLQNDRLITKEEVENEFKDETGTQFLLITDEDYVLGLADLTGELMRYAINSVGKGDHDRAIKVCQFLRDMKTVHPKSPLGRKVDTIRQSLSKVEDACYAITIRGSEYPKEFYQHIVSEHARSYEYVEEEE